MWVPYKAGEVVTPQANVVRSQASALGKQPGVAAPSNLPRHAEFVASVSAKEKVVDNHPSELVSFSDGNVKQKNWQGVSAQVKWKNAMQFTDDTMLKPMEHPAHSPEVEAEQDWIAQAEQGKSRDRYNKKAGQKQAFGQKRSRNVLAFVGLYLLGTVLAGGLASFFTENQQLYLMSYIAQCVSVGESNQVSTLLLGSISSALITLSAIFLSGLSAFGIPLIILCLLCKGFGVGALLSQLYAYYQWDGVVQYFVCFGVTDALLATCMSLLSITASKSASAMWHYALQRSAEVKNMRLKRFALQYILFVIFMCAVCLLSTVGIHFLFGGAVLS